MQKKAKSNDPGTERSIVYEKLEKTAGLPAGQPDGADRVHRLRCQRRRTDDAPSARTPKSKDVKALRE